MSQQQSGPVGPREAAQRNQAPDLVVDRLRQLFADQEFQNTQDVARAAGLGTEERRT